LKCRAIIWTELPERIITIQMQQGRIERKSNIRQMDCLT